MLLDGDIRFDQRVIKMISTLSSIHYVYLFYCSENDLKENIFNNNVKTINIYDKSFSKSLRKILRNSFFFFEFNFFIKYVKTFYSNFDVVWCNDLPTLYPGFILSRFFKSKLVYDSHEIYNETLNQQFPEKRKIYHSILLLIMKRFGTLIEKYLLKKVKTFITVNSSLKEYFKKHFKGEIDVVYNYPSIEIDKVTPYNYRKKYNWKKNSCIFIFQGTLNPGRGLMKLVYCIKDVNDNQIKLIIIGDGVLMKKLKDFVKKNKLENQIILLGRVDPFKLKKYTFGADYGINLIEEINLSKKFTTATKMFEYFQAGIPVLCSETKENKLICRENKCGILTLNDNDSIKSNLIKIKESSNIQQYKKNCLIAAKKFNWEQQKKIILNSIETN
jgi:glycosyltransferase involved in cell wall biosynthesis